MARDPYRRAARRARRAMRKGEHPYPVMMFGPEESFGTIAAAAIGRWLFRHRSAFVPFIVAGTAFTIALPRPSPPCPVLAPGRGRDRSSHGAAGNTAPVYLDPAGRARHRRDPGPHVGRLRDRPARRTRLCGLRGRRHRRMARRRYRDRPGGQAAAAGRRDQHGDRWGSRGGYTAGGGHASGWNAPSVRGRISPDRPAWPAHGSSRWSRTRGDGPPA